MGSSELNIPKVSVIIPFFNRSEFLSETIESVLNQSHTNCELILVDDGSTDDSADTAMGYAQEYPSKVFLCSHPDKANRGAGASRNLGLRHATGDFISFLDSDDLLVSDALESELRAFEQNPKAGAVCGTLEYWFSWRRERNGFERDFVVNLGVETEKLYKPPSLLVHNLIAGGRKPGMGCVMIRNSLARDLTLFKDDFVRGGEDQIFWATVSLNTMIYVTEKCLVKYRQHDRSSTVAFIESGKANDDWDKFLTWLENYLESEKIEDRKLLKCLENSRKHNAIRTRYEPILRIYRKLLPFHLRYWIRDFAIGWRKVK